MRPKRQQPTPEYVAHSRAWLEYADGDLITAQRNHADELVPNRNVAYMAQQAAEKAMKAVILLENQPFDMIHDLDALAADLPGDFEMPASGDDLSWLTDVETTSRYPDTGEEVTQDDADRAVTLAEQVVAAAHAHFRARVHSD